MSSVPDLLRALADVLLPPACLACDGDIDARDSARLVCRRCRTRLRPLPTPACARCGAPRLVTGRSDDVCAECRGWPIALTAARSACLLMPPADRIVHQLKYRGWPALAEPMAQRMKSVRLPGPLRDAATCVPVPTTAARLRQRGYNQAERLASAFAIQTGRTVSNALQRAGSSGSQTTLQPLARSANVAGAFSIRDSEHASVEGRNLILVDDVLTTGATATACATVLVAAGALTVSLITFARAIDARRLTQLHGVHDDHG